MTNVETMKKQKTGNVEEAEKTLNNKVVVWGKNDNRK